MRGIVVGFWMTWIGWGWMTYGTGKVENMDAAGGLFFVLGSLVVLYKLVFNNLIPVGGVRLGLSLVYIAWGWDWAFWRIAPAGNYLDLTIGSYTLSVEIILILVGGILSVYDIYRYLTNPLTARAAQNIYPTLATIVKNLTWEQIQRVVGKLLGICIEVVFLLFGFSFMSSFLDATPSPVMRFTLAVFFAIVATMFLMALGYSASLAEERRGVPVGSAGAYVMCLGLAFLCLPEGDLVRAVLLVSAGFLLMRNSGDLNAKNYLPGKGMLTGIGCLLVGLFDLLYVPRGSTVIAPVLTPSLQGGLFMGHRILEGLALILAFISLVILPRINVHRNTLKVMFLVPLILYGISLVVPIGTVEFAADQAYSIFWIRGMQMTVVAGVLALAYSITRLVPQYRTGQLALGTRDVKNP